HHVPAVIADVNTRCESYFSQNVVNRVVIQFTALEKVAIQIHLFCSSENNDKKVVANLGHAVWSLISFIRIDLCTFEFSFENGIVQRGFLISSGGKIGF